MRGAPNKAAAMDNMVMRILVGGARMRILRIGDRDVSVVLVRLRYRSDDV
jgi:hypothetical protein